jgi:hypothetical protein
MREKGVDQQFKQFETLSNWGAGWSEETLQPKPGVK